MTRFWTLVIYGAVVGAAMWAFFRLFYDDAGSVWRGALIGVVCGALRFVIDEWFEGRDTDNVEDSL